MAATLMWLVPLSSAQALDVFTCEPEWAALVKALAPDARVTSATHARQDPHHIEARPALISALRRAQLAVCTGASLEAGWLPVLQQRAGNASVQEGRAGMFYAASVVHLAHAHEHVDRSMGDVHAEGNPHLHLDPRRLKQVASALADRLARVDPANAAIYRDRHRAWATDWDRRIEAWEDKAGPLAGTAVVAQHTAFSYLWEWLGIEQVADLEPKPGLPPTPSHLRQVLQRVRDTPPAAVVQALYQDPQAGQWLVGQIGTPLLVLPATVTPDGPARTLEGLYDTLIDELLRAAAKPKP
ncbi:zinc ABC transporter substrate-binding protein [Schlegelella sp. S2-27]|uniref:Zinc ABC transporter substrate-binding protein n=1 Tax=Caldimonas mangrovi TaxID=2944811 RepID=A0ABT0YHF7_9BURK|nr:zinc ABC transporter substrate-binding protein [Caldimonas mangrovi]MCM5678145.1 zinc ABC transporter substrate-binding protein [Caldimonas mangrovi]